MPKDVTTYCPSCFSPTLTLKSTGIVQLIINGKKMDSGRFMYDRRKSPQELKELLLEKLDDFFKWYSKFNNILPITEFELNSNNFECTHHCIIKPNFQISVIGILIPKETVLEAVYQKGKEYNIEVNLSL